MGALQPHTQVDTGSIPRTDVHTGLPLTQGVSAVSVLLTHPKVSPPREAPGPRGVRRERKERGCLAMFGANAYVLCNDHGTELFFLPICCVYYSDLWGTKDHNYVMNVILPLKTYLLTKRKFLIVRKPRAHREES